MATISMKKDLPLSNSFTNVRQLPAIKNMKESSDNILSFTVENIDLSIMNGLRRAIIAYIPVIVLSANSNIIKNTIAKATNEYIKHRLIGIPVNINTITDADFPINNYVVELSMENTTTEKIHVKTNHFKIKNTINGRYLTDQETNKIFPIDPIAQDYILIASLKPKLAENILGEALQLTTTFTRALSGDDGMYKQCDIVANTFAVDQQKHDETLYQKIEEWKTNKDIKEDDLKLLISNWKLIDGKRITLPDTFDFILRTVGVYTNKQLIYLAIQYIVGKLEELIANVETQNKDKIKIETSIKSELGYDIYLLNNEEYTIGNMLEKYLYNMYFVKHRVMSFVGHIKDNPHDTYSILTVVYDEKTELQTLHQHLKNVCLEIITIVKYLAKSFT